MGDTDLMVSPEERKIVTEAMYELDYRYGRFDSRAGAILDFPASGPGNYTD